ncbi:MAG TPA: hypothetical protein PK763_04790, partial [Anaerolineaceae bacterium]|nr:hypothetical protein [Anaerolineaceae bacterium]
GAVPVLWRVSGGLPRASTAAGIHGHRSSAHPDKRANCDYNTDYVSTNACPNEFCIDPKP